MLSVSGLVDHALSEIEGALCPLADDVPCEDCKKALADRIKQVVVQWSMVKVRHIASRCLILSSLRHKTSIQ